jgi:hypothetical protein
VIPVQEGIVSLAADGSLWLWRGGVAYAQDKLIPPSAKPVALGNVLAAK